jgi:hypothetical protein
MKIFLQSVFVVSTLLFVMSCSDDAPAPDKIIGTWKLDDAIYSNAPSGYQLSEGTANSVYGEEVYQIKFFDDNTYERDLSGNGVTGEDEGDWKKEGDDLTLDYDKGNTGFVLEFTIVEEVTDKNLELSASASILAFPDDILNDAQALDTITTQESYIKFIEEYANSINLDVQYSFDRE